MFHLFLFVITLVIGALYWNETVKEQQLHDMYKAAATSEQEYILRTGKRLPMGYDYAWWTATHYVMVANERVSVHSYLARLETEAQHRLLMEKLNTYSLQDLGLEDEGPVETAMNHIIARKTAPLISSDSDPAISTLTRQRS